MEKQRLLELAGITEAVTSSKALIKQANELMLDALAKSQVEFSIKNGYSAAEALNDDDLFDLIQDNGVNVNELKKRVKKLMKDAPPPKKGATKVIRKK